MKSSSNFYIPIFGMLSLLFAVFACNLTPPSRDQIQGGIATAQAAGERVSDFATSSAPTLQALQTQGSNFATNAAPTLAAAKEQAIEFATNAAPTISAVQTQAVIFATESAPTVEAGIEMAKTAVVDTQERAEQAKATLDAAGIDGRYLWTKVQSARPDETGLMLITFTETEINLALNAHLLVKKQEGELPPMDNIVLRLDDGRMFLQGRIENPIAADITLQVQPYVQNGELAVNIVAADANGYALPPFAMNQLTNMINRTVVDAINGFPFPATLENIFIGSDSITFAVRRS